VFSRVAIVNRGEAAMRLIHAVRELSAETGTRIETVAFYTDADRTALKNLLAQAGLAHDPAEFKRVASAKSLYHWHADANQEY